MKPKYVTSKEALEQLAEAYEKQGYQVIRPHPDRVEAYNEKTGKLVKVAQLRDK